MKGYRFFADYDSPAHRHADTVAHRSTLDSTPQPAGNALAVILDDEGRPVYDPNNSVECLSATFFVPNSDVSLGSVALEYLRTRCRRISEREARRIHPRLFLRLD